jgi:Flp pilus assembly protein TadG
VVYPVINLSKWRASRVADPSSGETGDAMPKHGRSMRDVLAGLLRDTSASVFVFMAVSMLALAAATGVGVDFARSLNFKSDLQGAVDAAAIAGASVYLNSGYSSQATTAATDYMKNATASLPTNNGVTSSVVVTQSAPWNVTVNANATINSTFNGVLENTIPISVTATANGPTNPNIDFYMLLDSSPSMAIAATTAGIATMVDNTQGQCDSAPYGGSNCGCGFACHESNPGAESHYIPVGTGSTVCKGPTQITGGTGSPPSIALGGTSQTVTGTNHASSFSSSCSLSGTGNPNIAVGTGTPTCTGPTGTGSNYSATFQNCAVAGSATPEEDNYALARSLGVPLRIDNLTTATQNLMSTASSTATTNSAIYRVAINTFDVNFNTIQALTANLNTAKTSASNIAQLEVYSNNYLTSGNDNSDADTNIDNAMTSVNTLMPNPGSGTNAQNDTPQEVLFFVTDGVEDELVNGNRVQSLMNTAWCNTIKNRGIRIAVLYTVYYPLPTNGWYNTYISPFDPNIASTMQSCASPGLFFSVDTGGDISAAMAALFTSAVNSAYISR